MFWRLACSTHSAMVLTASLVLVLVALVCFAAAAFGVAVRMNLVAAGLFLWLLSTVVR
jgi:hypothetical protein